MADWRCLQGSRDCIRIEKPNLMKDAESGCESERERQRPRSIGVTSSAASLSVETSHFYFRTIIELYWPNSEVGAVNAACAGGRGRFRAAR